MKNLFTFWDGPKPQIISLLEQKMHDICKSGGYHFIQTSSLNLMEYIDLPENYNKLRVQHKSDVARVKLINKYGGIWMDADTLILGDIAEYFARIEDSDGFFLKNDFGRVTNANFGSRPQTKLMKEWECRIDYVISRHTKFPYELIGNTFLSTAYSEGKLSSYTVTNMCDKEAPIRTKNIGEYLIPNKERLEKILTSNPSFLILQAPAYRGYEKLPEEQKKETLLYSLMHGN